MLKLRRSASNLLRFNSVWTIFLVPAIDDQLFYTMTGYSELGESPVSSSEHFSENEFYRFRNVSDLQAEANTATQLLASAFTVSDPAFIEPLRERAEAARSRIERSLSVLKGTEYEATLALIFARLFDLSLGHGSGFQLLARELELTQRQHELLEQNREIAVLLVAEVDDWVQTAERHVAEVSSASEQSIFQGRVFLLAISAASIIGAFLITWLFVGKSVAPSHSKSVGPDAQHGGWRPRNRGRNQRT